MPDTCTVVIGAPQHLDALRERAAGNGEVLVFSDVDTRNALEAISKRRPAIVMLERLFAATSRGAALINRIKADPELAFAEIRVTSHDGRYSRVSHRRTVPVPKAPQTAPVAVAEPGRHLDWRGTRRAARVRMQAGTEAQVDGTPALLVDLSAIGAQVVAQAPLKPNQRVRIALADDTGTVRFNGAVAWAFFEIPQGGTRYRAGIEFKDAKADAVNAFAERHRDA